MTHLTNNIYAVEIPEDAKKIMVVGNSLRWKMNPLKFWWDFVKLPTSSFTLLFTSKDGTEDDWKKVVHGEGDKWDNYNGWSVCKTPTESGHSLLRSKGLDVNNNYAIIKNNQEQTLLSDCAKDYIQSLKH